MKRAMNSAPTIHAVLTALAQAGSEIGLRTTDATETMALPGHIQRAMFKEVKPLCATSETKSLQTSALIPNRRHQTQSRSHPRYRC